MHSVYIVIDIPVYRKLVEERRISNFFKLYQDKNRYSTCPYTLSKQYAHIVGKDIEYLARDIRYRIRIVKQRRARKEQFVKQHREFIDML